MAALSLAVDLWRDIAAFDGAGEKCLADVASRIEKAVDHLATARPTAVNLFRSCQDIKGEQHSQQIHRNCWIRECNGPIILEIGSCYTVVGPSIGEWGQQATGLLKKKRPGHRMH